MLRRVLASSRYLVVIAVLGTLAAARTLLVYETLVVAEGVIEAIRIGSVSAAKAKLLAVLFLREAVSWDGQSDLLELAAALALMIAVLVFFLSRKSNRQD